MSKELERNQSYTCWFSFQGELETKVLVLLKRNRKTKTKTKKTVFCICQQLYSDYIWFFEYFRIKIFLTFLFIWLSSVQFSRSVMSDSLRPRGLQHARLPCPSPTPWAYSNSCPSRQWCHPNTRLKLKKASVDYFCPRNTTNNFANQTILTPASVLVPITGTMLILSL